MKQYKKLISGVALVALLVTSIIVSVPSADAAYDQIKDTMTNQTQGQTSDHIFVIDLPTGTTYDASTNDDVISIDFDETSAFTTAGIWVGGDFTITDGTTTWTPMATVTQGAGAQTPSCAGAAANEVAIAIDTTALLFEFEACSTTSFAASTDGAAITITIDGTTTDGTLTNPSAPQTGGYVTAISMTDEGTVDAQTGSLSLPIIANGDVSVRATVDPTISLSLDIGDNSANTAIYPTDDATNSVVLGSLSSASIITSGTSGVNSIGITGSTNATGGMVVKVRGAKQFSTGSYSALETSGSVINEIGSLAATQALSSGSEGYGICVSDDFTIALFSAAANFNADVNCTSIATSVTVGSVPTADTTILSTTGTVSNAQAVVYAKAAISATTAAGSYADTLTFTAVGTF